MADDTPLKEAAALASAARRLLEAEAALRAFRSDPTQAGQAGVEEELEGARQKREADLGFALKRYADAEQLRELLARFCYAVSLQGGTTPRWVHAEVVEDKYGNHIANIYIDTCAVLNGFAPEDRAQFWKAMHQKGGA